MPGNRFAVAERNRAGTLAHRLDHLDRLCDERGLFEHAEGIAARPEHGYCVDDNARLLVVAAREPDVGLARRLVRLSLEFVCDAQTEDGRIRNRLDVHGRWSEGPSTEDCWGRSLWGLGVAAAQHGNPSVRRSARRAFDNGVCQRSPWPRAMAFAALGAAEVAAIDPDHVQARLLLADALETIGPVLPGAWCWTEPRLRYSNASLAEAVVAAGAALGDGGAVDRGLAMLTWLLDVETRAGHLSVTPVSGRGPDDRSPLFDQQSIEVAAIADACWRAHEVTGERMWSEAIALAARWFDGVNDTRAVMHDPTTGGGFDGLQRNGVNHNQGAESTLAYVSTMQRAEALLAPA